MDEHPTGDEQGRDEHKPADFIGMGALIGIGASSGLIFGTMLHNLGLGLAAGTGLGTVAGAVLEANRRHH